MLIPIGFLAASGAGASMAPDWFGQLSTGVRSLAFNGTNVYASGGTTAFSFTQLGAINWQRNLGSPTTSMGNIGFDSSGNVYGSSNQSGTQRDANVSKWNSSGVLQWVRQFGDSNWNDNSNGMAVSASGNSYITGNYYNSSGNAFYAYVIKYDSSGNVSWQRQMSGNNPVGAGIAIDNSENVYMISYSAFTSNGIWLLKLNSSGTLQWQRTLGNGVSNTTPLWVTVDGSTGDSYIASNVTVGGVAGIHLAKYNTSGTLQWQRTLSGLTALYTQSYSLTLDGSGYLYVSGNNFMVKYNTSGTLQWQRKLNNGGFGGGLVANSNYIWTGGGASGFHRLPADGSKTGSYVVGTTTFTYEVSSFTDATASLTDASGSVSVGTGSLTTSTSSTTDSAGTATLTKSA